MPEQYLSLSGECVTEKVIEKSKFITVSKHIVGEEQAKAFIAEIAQAHRDATHNCFAYIADSVGNFLRFSDDGEPQGTAGMPMLEVLKTNNLRETAVVVIRYFGGIKLGAGGLVRAYSGCVAENIASAKKVSYEKCSKLKCTVAYNSVDSASKFFADRKAEIIETQYLNEVIFAVAVKTEDEENFRIGLINYLNGKVSVQKTDEYFYPFEI